MWPFKKNKICVYYPIYDCHYNLECSSKCPLAPKAPYKVGGRRAKELEEINKGMRTAESGTVTASQGNRSHEYIVERPMTITDEIAQKMISGERIDGLRRVEESNTHGIPQIWLNMDKEGFNE